MKNRIPKQPTVPPMPLHKADSKVNHPAHYQGKYEAIDVIEDACESCPPNEAFSYGNALKYLLRAFKKHHSPVEDLEKAIWYIQRVIRQERRWTKR